MNHIFHKIIEANLTSIPLLQVVHSQNCSGRNYVIRQTVSRNVFTDFDLKLSRHLAATKGAGFPAFTVMVEAARAESVDKLHQLASAYHNTKQRGL